VKLIVAVVVVASLPIAACGRNAPDVSDQATSALAPQVQEIRTLATERRADAVATKLDELRAEVARLQTQGRLSQSGAARILTAAEAVGRALPLITTTTTTTTSTTTTAPPPAKGKDHGNKDGPG
jgi:hypothetical protein